MLNPVRTDRTTQFLFSTVLLDCLLTTIGLIVIGPKWESNQLYKSEWENMQYALFVGTWVLDGIAYVILAYSFIGLKGFLKSRAPNSLSLAVVNAVIVYAILWTLYHGPLGWSTALACNYVSSVDACYAYASSSPVFGALNFLFPII